MPKFDMGIIQVTEDNQVKAHFRNQQGTEWVEDATKLDKHFVFRGDQMIMILNWIDKILINMKEQVQRGQKKRDR